MQTYRAQGYRGRGQADEAAVPRMGLVDGIGIFVTELGDDALDPVEVCSGEGLADEASTLR